MATIHKLLLARIAKIKATINSIYEQKSLSIEVISGIQNLNSTLIDLELIIDSDKANQLSGIDFPQIDANLSAIEDIISNSKFSELGITRSYSEFNQALQNLKLIVNTYRGFLVNEELRSIADKIREDADKAISQALHLQESRVEGKIVELEKGVTDALENSKTSIAEIDKILQIARELQEELSGRTLSGHFSERAKTEKASATRWTITTWIFASTALVVLIASFILHILKIVDEPSKDWQLLSTKILLTLTLGLIAKWASKRASKHLADEAKYHRLAINLITVESFVSKLTPENKEEVMKAIALNIFIDTTSYEGGAELETAAEGLGLKELIPNALKKVTE